MKPLSFIKMHGLGNDFVLLDHLDQLDHDGPWLAQELVRQLADRRLGIGCDQVVQLVRATVVTPDADAVMRIYNADGSRAEMCGNAARCVADYLYRHRRIVRDIRIHTLAGPIAVQGDGNGRWSVDMGCPIFEAERIPTLLPGPVMGQLLRVGDTECRVTALSMGNPHCVLFVEHLDAAPVAQLGPALCEHTVFPRRTNVEWVEVIDRSRIRMRVWERGAGITPACGTGACAAAVAAAWHGYTDRHLWVQLDGGELEIIWNQNDHVTMTGPATEVFSGQFACTRQEE